MGRTHFQAVLARILTRLVVVTSFALLQHAFGETAPRGKTLGAGDIRTKVGFYGVVFYYAPEPTTDTRALAESLLKKFLPGVQFTSDPENAPNGSFVGFEEEAAPLKMFPVPKASYFKHSGRGLSAKDIEAMQKTSRATQIVFVMPKEDVWTKGRLFSEFALEFARQSGAYLWDSSTRECFSQDEWKKRRLNTWQAGDLPDIGKQITIHLYRPEDQSGYLRAITLGMQKFALPDVVIEELVHSDNRSAGNLINVVCQLLAERPKLRSGGRETFRISEISTASVREEQSKDLESGATLEATLALVEGEPQEGDPENGLIELDFRHGHGSTPDEKRHAVLANIWGASDSIKELKHTPEILAASARAKAKLVEFQKHFAGGLAPGERFMVKAPFKTDKGGNEWMWVEVLRWPKQGSLEGTLQNDPFDIKDLRAGTRVKVPQSDVFDYLFYRPNGEPEGNETGKLIEKLSGRIREK